MIKANYHTHSAFCDGRDTPEEILRYASSRGFTHLGFSGHMDPDIRMDFPAYLKEIRRLQKNRKKEEPDILAGVELDILYDRYSKPGEGFPDAASICSSAEYVIGSTHFLDVETDAPASIDSEPENIAMICGRYYSGDYYKMCRAYYDLESRVYDALHCTFIGHFDLITRFNDDLHFVDETDPRYLNPALEAMEHLAKQGVPFEINCGAVNRGRKKELYPHPLLLRSLKDFGGEIVLSSDAHQKELLCGAFDQAVSCAVSCGFTHTNILEHDPSGKVSWRQVALDAI